jgi:hypothetical protein
LYYEICGIPIAKSKIKNYSPNKFLVENKQYTPVPWIKPEVYILVENPQMQKEF